MRKILRDIINGVGSLLDLSGEYEDVEFRKTKDKVQTTDSEKIHNDFVRVGDYISHSIKSKSEENQLGFDFTDESHQEPIMQ